LPTTSRSSRWPASWAATPRPCPTTPNIYIEAAFWFPKAVAGRSRHFNFSTDAGHRFERGVDPEFTTEHIERITALVLEICGTPETQVGAMDDQKPNMPAQGRATARGACGQGHRHGRDPAAMPGCAERPGSARHVASRA
jgi:hypothetical protein